MYRKLLKDEKKQLDDSDALETKVNMVKKVNLV